MVCTVLGGTLAAGGANAINMVVDRDIDRLMERTKNRPLVTGAMSPRAALTFAIGLEVVAFAFLWGTVNLLSAVLAVSACLFYVFVYTLWLKRTSTHNIVIGGAAGAVPDADRLELGHRHARLGARRPVRHHLLLDAAPLLGPGHPLPGGLRGRRRADAAGRWRACDARRADPRLHAAALGPDRGFSPVAGMGHLYLGPPSCSAGSSPASPSASGAWTDPARAWPWPGRRRGRAAGRGHADLRLVDHLHHLAVRGHGRRSAPPIGLVSVPRRHPAGSKAAGARD